MASHCLVCAMHIMLSDKSCSTWCCRANAVHFCILLPELHGESSYITNAHLMSHLAKYVRLWGPLWTHSAFGFEPRTVNGPFSAWRHAYAEVRLLFRGSRLGGQLRELNVWRSMGKIQQFDALPSVAPPTKKPRAKDWCHYIAQRVCFKLSFVGSWYYILRERYTPLKSTHSYQNDYHRLREGLLSSVWFWWV